MKLAVFSQRMIKPRMSAIWLSAVTVLAFLEGIYGADSVTQTEDNFTISQGEPVCLNCTYQFSVTPYALWYVQFPSQALTLFLREVGREDSDEGIKKGFDATHDEKDKSFYLWKPSSEQSDSASDTVTRTGRELSKNQAGGRDPAAGLRRSFGGSRAESHQLPTLPPRLVTAQSGTGSSRTRDPSL
ncbi:unnamed protein product [Natator depressus]